MEKITKEAAIARFKAALENKKRWEQSIIERYSCQTSNVQFL